MLSKALWIEVNDSLICLIKSSFVISVTESSSFSFVLIFSPSVLLLRILLISFPFVWLESVFLAISSSWYFLTEVGLLFSLSLVLPLIWREFDFDLSFGVSFKTLISSFLFLSWLLLILFSISLFFSFLSSPIILLIPISLLFSKYNHYHYFL